MIATPDHTHAVISMAAMQAGKHVYCQKPLTHDVYEARQLAKAAKECKVATQMGIQGHSHGGHPADLRVDRGRGLIGEVREVDAWCSLTYYPWGHAGWSSAVVGPAQGHAAGARQAELGPVDRPGADAAVPPGVPSGHVALLVGLRLRHDGRPRRHTLDPGVHGPEAWTPDEHRGHRPAATAEEVHPLSAIVTFRFPARAGHAAAEAHLVRRHAPAAGRRIWRTGGCVGAARAGLFFKGSKGTIMAGVYGESPRLIPEAKMKAYKTPPRTLPRVEGHYAEFIGACRKGTPAVGAPFSYAARLTEVILLGNIAKRFPNTPLAWDPREMKFTNHDEANRFVRTPYREGWAL